MKTIERILAGCEMLAKSIKSTRKEVIPKVHYPDTSKASTIEAASYILAKNQLKVDFKEKEYYQTIDSYKTINGVKHKILSDVKLKKEKIVTVTYDFTTEEMQKLDKCKDKQLRDEYELIYCLVQDVSVYPIKFQKMILKYYHDAEVKRLAALKPNPKELTKTLVNPLLLEEKELEKTIKNCYTVNDALANQLVSLQKKKVALGYKGKANFKSVITFGAKGIKHQMEDLDKKTELTYQESVENYKRLFSTIEEIRRVEEEINNTSYSIVEKEKTHTYQCELEEKMYERDQLNISCPYREKNQLTISEKITITKPDVEYKYNYPATKNDIALDLDTYKYDDLYAIYEGYKEMALFTAKLKDNSYVCGISFNMANTLESLKPHLNLKKVEINIKLYVNKEDIINDFSELETKYNLEFIY